MNTNETISQRLSDWVDNHFERRKDFGELMQWSEQSTSQYLSGKRGLGPAVRKRLEKLNVPVKWIMFGDEDYVPPKQQNTLKIGIADVPVLLADMQNEIKRLSEQLEYVMGKLSKQENRAELSSAKKSAP